MVIDASQIILAPLFLTETQVMNTLLLKVSAELPNDRILLDLFKMEDGGWKPRNRFRVILYYLDQDLPYEKAT
jgi:hypothetical protein